MFGYEDYGYMELCCGLYMVIWVCPKIRDLLGFYDQLIQEDDGKGSIIKSGVLITGGLWPSHRNGGFLTPGCVNPYENGEVTILPYNPTFDYNWLIPSHYLPINFPVSPFFKAEIQLNHVRRGCPSTQTGHG